MESQYLLRSCGQWIKKIEKMVGKRLRFANLVISLRKQYLKTYIYNILNLYFSLKTIFKAVSQCVNILREVKK